MEHASASTKLSDTLEWSNEELNKISEKAFYPVVKDSSAEKLIVKRFLDFYLGGRREKGLGVEDIVFAVLAIMPISPRDEKRVWSSKQFREDGKLFYLSPEDKVANEVQNIISDAKEDLERMDKCDNMHMDADNIEESDNVIENNLLTEIQKEIHLPELHNETESTRVPTNDISERENVPNNNRSDDGLDVARSLLRNALPKFVKYEARLIDSSSESTVMSYGPVENAAFINFCNKTLDEWIPPARTVLKSLFAVVALILMRATTKSYKHLATTFYSEKFLRFLRNMKNHVPSLSYHPPHKRCLKAAYRTFSRKDNNTPVMFAKLVLLSGYSNIGSYKFLSYVLKNGLINYTADYGLNLVSLWLSIQAAVSSKDAERILELTLNEKTKSSWEKLINFLSKYKSVASQESFYRWARVLDRRFFREVSCQENHALAVMLSVFAERLAGGAGVWHATWVRNDDEEDTLKQIATDLYEQYAS